MRASLIRLSSPRREISFLMRSISSLSRIRALMLFAATLRAWVRDVCARESHRGGIAGESNGGGGQ